MEVNVNFNLDTMLNSWNDLVILRNIGVSGNAAAPKEAVSVTWWPPLPGWIKVNTDGLVMGSPGNIHAGGVFRDACNRVCGCFHIDGGTVGTGFAFEAELLAVITATGIAVSRGWTNLWLEADSTYVVHLLEMKSSLIPWRFSAAWFRTLSSLQSLEFRVSHIYRERNDVADIMARPTTRTGFWSHSLPIIDAAVERDMASPRFYRWR